MSPGARAIGGYVCARLAKHGADVVLFARRPHIKVMQERGLRLRADDSNSGDQRSSADRQGQRSCVSASRRTRSLVWRPSPPQLFGPDTFVVSTQHGVHMVVLPELSRRAE